MNRVRPAVSAEGAEALKQQLSVLQAQLKAAQARGGVEVPEMQDRLSQLESDKARLMDRLEGLTGVVGEAEVPAGGVREGGRCMSGG